MPRCEECGTKMIGGYCPICDDEYTDEEEKFFDDQKEKDEQDGQERAM